MSSAWPDPSSRRRDLAFSPKPRSVRDAFKAMPVKTDRKGGASAADGTHDVEMSLRGVRTRAASRS
jgi:hypothetical protein